MILPKEPPLTLAAWTEPSKWVGQDLMLFFICPLSMSIAGSGFDIQVPQGWIDTLAPVLQMGVDLLS